MTETALAAAPSRTKLSPQDYRHNAIAFALDSGFFFIAVSFISSTTVLPAFVAALSSSEVMVGLASGLVSGGWLLPQLFVASAVAHLPRKKPLVIRAAFLSRPIILIVALIVWLFGAEHRALALGTTMVGIFLFFMFDAVVSVPWFTLMSKCLPPTRRGRVIGASQIVGGIGGIGAGAIIRAVLGDRGALGFPYNYALLFGIGGVLFMVSAAFLTLIREPEAEIAPDETPPSPRVVLASMPGVLRRDRPFAVLIATKLLHGFVAMASSFYVLHTTLNLGLDVASAGLFVSAQVVGSLTAGLLMGIVQDRWGPLRHIRLTIIITALPPLLALAGGAFLGTAHLYVLPYYLAVFFLLGISAGSMGWPFFNWILEYAAERDRPIYIGLSNTLSAATMLAPALGGWIAKTVSYPAVFALAVLVALGAWVASSRVPDTRAGTST